ncbi:MAG TPA: hypothetical protein PKM36_02775 [Propionibacteriaceae bacterium]|nr:hypothetical protein [Propionibacteriaceae bacterium]
MTPVALSGIGDRRPARRPVHPPARIVHVAIQVREVVNGLPAEIVAALGTERSSEKAAP